jgi:hypothetical protein
MPAKAGIQLLAKVLGSRFRGDERSMGFGSAYFPAFFKSS